MPKLLRSRAAAVGRKSVLLTGFGLCSVILTLYSESGFTQVFEASAVIRAPPQVPSCSSPCGGLRIKRCRPVCAEDCVLSDMGLPARELIAGVEDRGLQVLIFKTLSPKSYLSLSTSCDTTSCACWRLRRGALGAYVGFYLQKPVPILFKVQKKLCTALLVMGADELIARWRHSLQLTHINGGRARGAS